MSILKSATRVTGPTTANSDDISIRVVMRSTPAIRCGSSTSCDHYLVDNSPALEEPTQQRTGGLASLQGCGDLP